MNNTKALKDVIIVALSNISTILSGVLVALLLPKIMSIDSFGYYKTFTLYVTYSGLFSLGIVDGIVLKYGSYDYSDLDKYKFRSLFRWYIIIHLIFCIILICIGFYIPDKEYLYIVSFFAVFMIFGNVTGYFQQISQITQRFFELSVRKVIQSALNIIIVFALYILFIRGYSIDYKLYIGLWIFANIILTFWYLYTYRDLILGKAKCLKSTIIELRKIICLGFPLLFANLCSTLILNLDRQYVNLLFDTKTYAVYAFAYNMLALVTVATSAISTVLFPSMKREKKEILKKSYSNYVASILAFVFFAITSYFPICAFIKWFLPKYTDSLVVFRIIFPGIAISSTITVIMHNYYKVYGDNFYYFKKSVVVLIISTLCNFIAYKLFHKPIYISMSSILVMLFWYKYIEDYLVSKYEIDSGNNFIYLNVITICFYILSNSDDLLNGCVYFLLYLILTWFFYKNKAIIKN